ncbi:MAG TPA: uracil-DNA glycosylase, partial [Brevundimonas sp.]|nr:uracil-DNA glycosylase [Brevundimonas sp.]
LKVIVTLGDVSRRSILRTLGYPGSAIPAGHGVEGRVGPYTLINSYHCSRLNTNTGRLTAEMFEDIFRRAKAALDA